VVNLAIIAVLAAPATLALGAGGCTSAELAAPQVHARIGPAAAQRVKRVVALPATCGSLALHMVRDATDHATWEVDECSRAALEGIDQAVRAALDFAGYEVIDAERVNATTAQRHEAEQRNGRGDGERTSQTVGATFNDATPFEQAEILQELGADGVLNTRIWIGADVGMSGRRTVAVQVRLVASRDRALVWARRCELEVGAGRDPLAMERAARCAAKGARPQ